MCISLLDLTFGLVSRSPGGSHFLPVLWSVVGYAEYFEVLHIHILLFAVSNIVTRSAGGRGDRGALPWLDGAEPQVCTFAMISNLKGFRMKYDANYRYSVSKA